MKKETILYVVFGIGTTLVNYAIYYPLVWLGISYSIANVIAWIGAVIFAFITNKTLVFESKSHDMKIVVRELILFASSRLLSLAFEEVFLIVTISFLNQNEMLMKIVASVFVIIINYVLSKFIVFKKEKKNDEEKENN